MDNKASKRVPSWGPRTAQIAFIGQSPGKQEGVEGRPFVGPAGKVLREICVEVGIDPATAYYTNVCGRVLLGSEEPTPNDIAEGRARLQDEFAQLTNLRLIVLVGIFASQLVFDGAMRDMSGMEGLLFDRYPCTAVYHPSAALRARNKEQAEWMRGEIKRVLSLAARVGSPPSIIRPTRRSGVAGLLGSRSHDAEAPAGSLPVTPTVESDDWLRVLLDETLERQQPLWEEPVRFFRASEVSDDCPRSLCLAAMGHRMPIEARLRRIFNTGLAIEQSNILALGAARILEGSAQAEVRYTDPPILGHIDALVRRPGDGKQLIGEIKSINEAAFKRLPNEHGFVLAGESPLFKTHYKYIVQWNTYTGAPNLGLDGGFLLFESKDKQAQKFYWLLRDDVLLEDTLMRLRLAAPYILSDPMRVPPTSLWPDHDPVHSKCPRRYLCTRIPDKGADYNEVRRIDSTLRG